jgi:hypothetical protein
VRGTGTWVQCEVQGTENAKNKESGKYVLVYRKAKLQQISFCKPQRLCRALGVRETPSLGVFQDLQQ